MHLNALRYRYPITPTRESGRVDLRILEPVSRNAEIGSILSILIRDQVGPKVLQIVPSLDVKVVNPASSRSNPITGKVEGARAPEPKSNHLRGDLPSRLQPHQGIREVER